MARVTNPPGGHLYLPSGSIGQDVRSPAQAIGSRSSRGRRAWRGEGRREGNVGEGRGGCSSTSHGQRVDRSA